MLPVYSEEAAGSTMLKDAASTAEGAANQEAIMKILGFVWQQGNAYWHGCLPIFPQCRLIGGGISICYPRRQLNSESRALTLLALYIN